MTTKKYFTVVYDHGGFANESFDTMAEAKKRQIERSTARPKGYKNEYYTGDGSTIFIETITMEKIVNSHVTGEIKETQTS